MRHSALFSGVTLSLAPLPLCDRHLDSGTRKVLACATVKTECESEQTRELEDDPGFRPGVSAAQWRSAAWSSCSLGSLFLRDSPLKKRFAVVDAPSMPTPTLFRDTIRARADMWLLLVGARKKTGIMSCVSNVMC